MIVKERKRNYVRKKRFLQECAEQLRATVEFIHNCRGEVFTKDQVDREIMSYASLVEASCWSPHMHYTAIEYRNMMNMKAQDLCHVLIEQAFPIPDYNRLIVEAYRQYPRDNDKSKKQRSTRHVAVLLPSFPPPICLPGIVRPQPEPTRIQFNLDAESDLGEICDDLSIF